MRPVTPAARGYRLNMALMGVSFPVFMNVSSLSFP
jgi:hypothetical protein